MPRYTILGAHWLPPGGPFACPRLGATLRTLAGEVRGVAAASQLRWSQRRGVAAFPEKVANQIRCVKLTLTWVVCQKLWPNGPAYLRTLEKKNVAFAKTKERPLNPHCSRTKVRVNRQQALSLAHSWGRTRPRVVGVSSHAPPSPPRLLTPSEKASPRAESGPKKNTPYRIIVYI